MKLSYFIIVLISFQALIQNKYIENGDKLFTEGKKYQNSGWSEKAYQSFLKAIKSYKEALKKQPNNPVIYYKIGKSYYQIRYWKKAIENFKRAVDLSPDSVNFQIDLGYAYWKNMMFRESKKVFQKAVLYENLTGEQLNKLGFGFFKCNEIEKSIELFEKAIQKNQYNGIFHGNLAYALQWKTFYSSKNNYEKIVKEYEYGIKYSPDYLHNYIRYGLFLEEEKKFFRALKIYEKGIKKNPDFYLLYYYRDRIKLKYSGNPGVKKEVINEIKKLLDEKAHNANLLEAASFIYSILKDKKSEREINLKLMNRFPHSRSAENILYNYFLMESSPDKKIKLAEDYLRKYPYSADGYLQSIYLSLFSICLLDSIYYKKALNWGKKMIQYTHSNEHTVYLDFVRNLVNKGIFLDEAIIYGNKGIKVILTKTIKDVPYSYNKTKWENKINDCILEIKENIGWAYFLKGNLKQALNILQEVEKKKDYEKKILYKIGFI